MKTQHTQGPWSYDSRGVIYGNGATLAHVRSSAMIVNHDQDNANARLIAAAPELLEELQKIYGWVYSNALHGQALPNTDKALASMEKIIAKARGE